ILNGGFREGNRMVLNDMRPLIHNLDSLPNPDFSFEKEFVINESGKFVPNYHMRQAENFLISGSRGCVYSCHYCANSKLKSLYAAGARFARKMSVARFIEVVANSASKFTKARYIYFTDEDFFARPEEEIAMFAEGYQRKIGLPFECMASPLQITKRKAALLADAGMWRIDIGVESGSDRIKKYVFNRVANNQSVIEAAGIVNRHRDLVVYYFFIIGNPYEDREDLQETIKLLMTLPPPFFLRAYSLVFIPGTELFYRAYRDGILNGIEDSGYEMDFLGGFDERTVSWKLKELYLNSLIATMAGKITRFRMGILPRALLPFLTESKVIQFCNQHIWIGKNLARFSRNILKFRRASLGIVSGIIKNRKIAYGLKFIFRKARNRSRSRESELE
ncbi:MAG: radical SAM protein, partial [Candidatus Aminicenantes bacterium]|nr:radical SAM protein [Candidatus Aminicenantes bacterium]